MQPDSSELWTRLWMSGIVVRVHAFLIFLRLELSETPNASTRSELELNPRA